MRSTPSLLTAVVALFYAHQVAFAQYTTSATCSSSFDWAVNQQQQSPCLVAAYVQGACSATGAWEVPALPSRNVFYNPPIPMNACGCSIASYNLLSACAACQGADPPRFPYWINNCSIAGLLDTSTYYPTSKWPIPDGVQIPLWAQQDARLWTNSQFNSTEAQQIAASGNLIGPPLVPSSTSSSTATTPTSSPSSTPSAASPSDNHTDIGAIVGGVVGGVLGLLFLGVLIWWITRHRWAPFEDAGPNMSATESKGPTPTLVKMAVPVPLRPPHPTYPSSTSFPTPTSNGTGNAALGHSGSFVPLHYGATGVGPTFTPPSMASSTSVGRPSTEPQRMGSSSSRSMIARFVFPRRRAKRNSDAPSTLSQDSSRMSQIGILQSPPPNVAHLPQPPGTSADPAPPMLEPTPFIMPPVSQGSFPSSGGSTSYPREKVRINPPGYASSDVTNNSQPISAVQGHTAQPFNIDFNRMMVTTPDPMRSRMPDPPSYVVSQAETREDQLRRAASNATAGTLASSNNILPTPSTPERRGGPLASVPESAAAPHDEFDYPQEKV